MRGDRLGRVLLAGMGQPASNVSSKFAGMRISPTETEVDHGNEIGGEVSPRPEPMDSSE